MKTYYLIFTILVLLSACNRNRLKTDEKALTKQIFTEEEQLAHEQSLREEREKHLMDSIAKLPKGFRFKEERGVDPDHPPVVTDFTKEPDIREVKLSDIAQNVSYIRLRVPNDSLYFIQGGNVNFTDANIILNNNFGIHRFSRAGVYLEQIANSNIQNRVGNKQSMPGFFDTESYRGIWGNHVSVAGNHVYYKFSDYPNGKVSLFHYELKPGSQNLSFSGKTETVEDNSFTKGEFISSGKEAVLSGSPGLASTKIYGVSSNFFAGVNSHLDASRNGIMLATYSLAGDTLCKFTQFDKLETPITSTAIRTIPDILEWQYSGIFTFMKSFNDTIFRLIPPNRIVLAYVFNFGQNKITDEEWYNFSKKLNGKYKPEEFMENEKYLLLKYTFFVSNDLRETHYALFDKKSKILSRLKLDDELKNKTYESFRKDGNWQAGLENDLDNGFPFWPGFVTPEGNFGTTLYPEKLKDIFQRPGLDSNNDKSRELKSLVESLGNNNNERILMIIK